MHTLSDGNRRLSMHYYHAGKAMRGIGMRCHFAARFFGQDEKYGTPETTNCGIEKTLFFKAVLQNDG